MDLRAAAEAMLDSYGEHLNQHCARCTAAFAQLRAALEAAPPADTSVEDRKIEKEFKAAMGDRRG